MFMFQSGLLATFIPEIIMVIAYLVCLFSPGISKSSITSENPSNIISASTNYANEISSLHTFSLHSPTVKNCRLEFSAIYSQSTLVIQNRKIGQFFTNLFEILIEGFLYFQFSRPPPTFLSK